MESIDETLEISVPPPLELLHPLVPEARWTSTRLAVQLLTATQAFYADWTALQGRVPYAVYHYTDAASLNAILEAGRIWASDLLYLAGSRETDFVRDLIRDHLRKRAYVSDPVLRAFCEQSRAAARSAYLAAQHFRHLLLPERRRARAVACLRRAARGLRGRPAHQALTYGSGRYSAAALRRVIYDPERQNALISNLLDRAMFALRSPDGRVKRAMEVVLDFLADHMVELVACFKHIAFREDEEWRLLRRRRHRLRWRGPVAAALPPCRRAHRSVHGAGRLAARWRGGVADCGGDLRPARARGALRPRHRAAAQKARRHRGSRAAFGAGFALISP